MIVSFKTVLVVAVCGLFFISGCKKGEDDPAISLLTRKSRLTGTWYLTRGYAAITYYSANTTPNNFNLELYDNKALLTGSNYINALSLPYTLSLNFEKDGKFRVIENFDSEVLNSTGFWNFTSGVGKQKNKEAVSIRLDAIVTGDTQEHIFNNFGTEVTYDLKELRNKELVMTINRKGYINSAGEKGVYVADLAFAQK
jgi:hypothetical protein